MIEKKLERVESLNDPGRCQASGYAGQCPFKAVPGYTVCQRHIGHTVAVERKDKARLYRLTRYQTRINEIADNEQIKSLREEIGILRMTLETIVNACQSDTELILYSGRISDTVVKIEKLVSTCQRLEISTGEMMDKTKALTLANTIVHIIGEHISDPQVIDGISNEILYAILGPKSG